MTLLAYIAGILTGVIGMILLAMSPLPREREEDVSLYIESAKWGPEDW